MFIFTKKLQTKKRPKGRFLKVYIKRSARHLHRNLAALAFDMIFFVDVDEVRLIVIQLDFVVGGVAGDN
jgi:hypothetical protein